jgi:predicted permease
MPPLNTIEGFMKDLRYAGRMLRRNPGTTAVVVLSLGLAIGANTAIFSMVNALLYRKLPVKDPEGLFVIPGDVVPYRFFEKFRGHSEIFSEASGAIDAERYNVTVNGPGGGLDPGRVEIALVSGNYFSVLGVNAVAGRMLTPDDDRVPGGHPVAVISNGYWQRRFGSDPDAVGRTLTLNRISYTILGVAPRSFSGDVVGASPDIWFPLMMDSQVIPEIPLDRCWVRMVGRFQPGITLQQGEVASQVVFRQLALEEAGANPSLDRQQSVERWVHRLTVDSGATGYMPDRKVFRGHLSILMIIVLLVLTIACVNVANLLLAQSTAREREMAVRISVGASRKRIVRQLLTESVALALIGGALGLLLANWGTSALVRLAGSGVKLGPQGAVVKNLQSVDLHPDGRMLAFTAGLCLVTGILFGLAPAFRSAGASLSVMLSKRGADSASGARAGLAKLLVVSQVTLSLVVLIGAGLFLRTLGKLRAQNLGVDRDHVLLVWTAPGQNGLQASSIGAYWRNMSERLSTLPGVTSISGSAVGLLNGLENGVPSETMKIEGHEPKAGLLHQGDVVAPGYFGTLGQPLIAGRDFTESDSETGPRVVIINETDAKFFFGDENPVGKHMGNPNDTGWPQEIVGVVKDVKIGTARDERGHSYTPYRQNLNTMRYSWCVMIRTLGNPTALESTVRRELQEFDPNLPVLKIDTIDEQLNAVLVPERLVATVSGLLAAIALPLACLGLYGVISYGVTRRTNEIGIRLALGSTRPEVIRMVLREGMLLVTVGIAIGLPATIAASRLISSMLFGVRPSDPLTIFTATILLVAVATLAAFLPAYRASRVDPMEALRYE